MPDVKELIAQKGVETLEELQTWLKAGKDLVVEQSPLLIQEIIRWGIGSSIFYLCINLVVLSIGVLLIYRGYFSKKSIESWKDYSGGDPDTNQAMRLVETFVGCTVSLLCSIFACSELFNLIFILSAPRLYVLQELASLLKK